MKKEYIRYEIRTRQFSSDIIVGCFELYNNNKDRWEEHFDVICVPSLAKKEGDKLAVFICDALNNTL